MSEDSPERDGDMGVSSERVGPTGPGQVARTGERDVAPADLDLVLHTPLDQDPPPEQSAGGPEVQPDPVSPKATPPHHNPRDDA